MNHLTRPISRLLRWNSGQQRLPDCPATRHPAPPPASLLIAFAKDVRDQVASVVDSRSKEALVESA